MSFKPGFQTNSSAETTRIASWLIQPHTHLVHSCDGRYPPRLKQLESPPQQLFVRGRVELLDAPMIAIVGSRNATIQGCRNAEWFGRHLSRSGFTIISGLAKGIDIAAHRGGLMASSSTIAVLGTGIDRVYPAAHYEMAHEIALRGALVTEFELEQPARRWHFPRRNRIIAGLSQACLVVEAGLESGSLITAQWALEAGREVFALPGSIHSPLARGCHRLLREGAQLVESPEELLELLDSCGIHGSTPGETGTAQCSLAQPRFIVADSRAPLEAAQQELLVRVGFEPFSADQLSTQIGLTAEQVSLMLTALELSGMIIAVPGGYYQRSGSTG